MACKLTDATAADAAAAVEQTGSSNKGKKVASERQLEGLEGLREVSRGALRCCQSAVLQLQLPQQLLLLPLPLLQPQRKPSS